MAQDAVRVVVAHAERATLRVGDLFVKVDADPARSGREADAIRLAPVPVPRIRFHEPPVLGLEAVAGQALGVLGAPSPASSAAWAAAGVVVRRLHEAPLPPWPGAALGDVTAQLDEACSWLREHDVLPADVIARNRAVAEAALQPRDPVFVHGDLQLTHVFVDGDEVTGVIDWSEAGPGDALHDLAILTFGHEEHLADVVAGYGTDVDLDVVRGWWSARALKATPLLLRHGFDAFLPGCEVDVLLAVR